jgi:hypothetical protein
MEGLEPIGVTLQDHWNNSKNVLGYDNRDIQRRDTANSDSERTGMCEMVESGREGQGVVV